MKCPVAVFGIALLVGAGCDNLMTPVAPDAPRDLTAVGGLDSRVELAWEEPASGEPGSYRVYRASEGGDFDRIVEISGNLALYTDPTALNGTSYEYRVTALNDDSESDPSEEVWATPYYDFEEAWFSWELSYLPTEGEGVFFCTRHAYEDVERLCRLSTDGEVEQISENTNWGYPAVAGDRVYTLRNGSPYNYLLVWTLDLELVEAFVFEGPRRKELAYHDGELFTINRDDCVVDVLDLEGHYLRSIGERGHEGPGMGDPFGLDLSDDGTLYVVDQGEESLLAFDAATGELVWRISAVDLPPDFIYPADAAVAPDGFVYLVSGYWNADSFLVIDAAGRQIKRVPIQNGDIEMYAAVADDFTVAMAEGDQFGGYMRAYRPVGLSGSQKPPLVALEGGGTR